MATPSTSDSPPQPPEAPEVPHRFRVPLGRAIGLAVFLAVPLLAISGVLGVQSAEMRAEQGALSASLRYPTRLAHGIDEPITLTLQNRSAEPLDSLVVEFDSAYVTRFTRVSFVPDVTYPYRVTLTDVEPGATRMVYVRLEGDAFGRQRGSITATDGGADTLRMRVSTLVLP